MSRRRFRFQLSLRVLLMFVVVTSLAVWKFTPEIRAALIRLTSRISGTPFESTPKTRRPGVWQSFQAMHDWYEKQFVENENGFGLRRVFDFDEPFARRIEINGRLYRPMRLELVSFKDHESPVAYVNSWTNPIKKTYKIPGTRLLTAFEVRALHDLQDGSDFVYNGDADNPRFVGAIRAKATCLSCHDGKQGDLLGSFAYELTPVPQFVAPGIPLQ